MHTITQQYNRRESNINNSKHSSHFFCLFDWTMYPMMLYRFFIFHFSSHSQAMESEEKKIYKPIRQCLYVWKNGDDTFNKQTYTLTNILMIINKPNKLTNIKCKRLRAKNVFFYYCFSIVFVTVFASLYLCSSEFVMNIIIIIINDHSYNFRSTRYCKMNKKKKKNLMKNG